MLVTSALNAEAQEKLAKGLSTDLSWGQSTIMDKLQSYLVVPEAQELFQTQLAPKLIFEQYPLIVFEASSIDTLAINRLQGTQAKVLFDQNFQRLAEDMGLRRERLSYLTMPCKRCGSLKEGCILTFQK